MEAVSVNLGVRDTQTQSQLKGLKTRSLKMEASSPSDSYYATGWHALTVEDQLDGIHTSLLVAIETVLFEARDFVYSELSRQRMAPSFPSGDARAAHSILLHTSPALLPLSALEIAFACMQAEVAIAPTVSLWIITAGCQQSDLCTPQCAGSWGLARTVRLEASLLVRCMDARVRVPVVQGHAALLTEPDVLFADSYLVPRLASMPQLVQTIELSIFGHCIVTGGTRGLGLLTTRWLAQHGVRNVVAASLNGAIERDLACEWKYLDAACASAAACRCNTAEVTHVHRLLAPSNAVVGVWHAAGVLTDGVLQKQISSGLHRSYAGKAHGAWTLQCAHPKLPLQTCVFFSSAAALLGNMGQSSYSAANTCLDSLAARRREVGHISVSVQWGAWAEVGMAARGAAKIRTACTEAENGYARISNAQGMQALQTAVRPQAIANFGVVPGRWYRELSRGKASAFLSGSINDSAAKSCDGIASGRTECILSGAACTLQAASLQLVLDLVESAAGSAIDADTPLLEAGIDSLGAVELRQLLQRALSDSIKLPTTLVFDYPHARAIYNLVLEDFPMLTPCQAGPGTTKCMVSMDGLLRTINHACGTEVEMDTALVEAGLDSLGAVELRNQLLRDFPEVSTLPTTLAFDYPTARSIALLLVPTQPGPSDAQIVSSAHCRKQQPQFRFEPDLDQAHEAFPAAEMPLSYWIAADTSLDLHGIHHGLTERSYWTLNLQRFRNAWSTMFRRHAALRIAFLEDGRCQVLPHLDPALDVFDLTDSSTEEASMHLSRVWSEWSLKDPPGPPYIRHFVTLLPDGQQRVYEYFCGLPIDFASFVAIKLEALSVYCSPDTLLRPIANFSFRDYVIADRAVRLSDRGIESWDWWQARISKMPLPLSLPLSSQRVGRANMSKTTLVIPTERWAVLMSRCQQLGISASVCYYGTQCLRHNDVLHAM